MADLNRFFHWGFRVSKNTSQEKEFLFDAFLSYSQAADGALAPSMQAAMEKIARPWYSLRTFRIFRDATNLSLNPHLWTAIEANLKRSKWLILLASKEAAKSRWVIKELAWWLENRSVNTILMVVTDGDIQWNNQVGAFDPEKSTAVPPLLHSAFVEEPFFADLRWARQPIDVSQYSARFRSVIIDVAATVRGVSKDEMDGEAVRTLRKNRLWATGGALLLVVVSLWALLKRNEAVENATRTAVELEARQVIAVAQTKSQAHALPLSILAANSARERLSKTPVSVLSALRYGIDSSREFRRWEAGGQVMDVVFEPDGKHLLTVLRDNKVLQWNVDGSPSQFKFSSREKLMFDEDQFSIELTPSKTAILTRTGKNNYRVWALDGTALASGHTFDTKIVGVAPGGRNVYTINKKGEIYWYDSKRRNPVLLTKRNYNGVFALHVSADDQWILIVLESGYVDAINLRSHHVASFYAGCHEASGISSKSQIFFVVGCGRAYKIDLATQKDVSQEHTSFALVKEISVDSNGQFILAHRGDDRVDVFSENGLLAMDSLLGVEGPSVAISPDGMLAATAGYLDGTVRIFDLSLRSARSITSEKEKIATSTLDVCKDRPEAYWGTQSGALYQVDYLTPTTPPLVWQASKEYIDKVRCIPGSGAVVFDRGGYLTYWRSQQEHQLLHAGTASVNTGIAVTHAKRNVFLPTPDGILGWSLDSDLRSLPTLTNPLPQSGWWQVILGNSDRTLIIGNDNGSLAGIDLSTGKTKFQPKRTLWSNVWTLAADSADRGFVSAGAGTEIKVFDWNGVPQLELRTDRFIFATDAAFDSASDLLAIPTMNGEVIIEDQLGNIIGSPLRNVGSNQFVNLIFTNDGYLLTAGLGHNVILHDFNSARLFQRACQILSARRIPGDASYSKIEKKAMSACKDSVSNNTSLPF